MSGNANGPPFVGAHGHSCGLCVPTVWWHMAFDSECNEPRAWPCSKHRESDLEIKNPSIRIIPLPTDIRAPTEDPRRYGHPRFYEILDKMAALHSAKAHDYAGDEDPLSNFRMVGEATFRKPWQIAWQFIATKFYRLTNLFGSGKDPSNESIEDTLMDMAIYSILTIIMLEEDSNGNES